MQRTHKRAIQAGRLTPAEGLAIGVAMALTSVFLMVAFVNWLAALLTLAGIIYYVLIYSIFLKKTTVQNIVIGGGAGAIPPLVGWAAATGNLNIPSLFLFAVIFMWTPPHFWALALVRRSDYARAGVPMLPVIRGSRGTRWQIFIYTIWLVGLTLMLPVFGLGAAVYLTGAGVLGLWLLSAAWRVWKQGGNKLAWKMYRYSSMYLVFLFLVLTVDPTAVTAYMAVGAKAAGFAALLRVFVTAFPSLSQDIVPVLWALSVLTMILGNVVAIAQSNIKRMLAYSSIAHAGYILMALVPYGSGSVSERCGGFLPVLPPGVCDHQLWGLGGGDHPGEGGGPRP